MRICCIFLIRWRRPTKNFLEAWETLYEVWVLWVIIQIRMKSVNYRRRGRDHHARAWNHEIFLGLSRRWTPSFPMGCPWLFFPQFLYFQDVQIIGTSSTHQSWFGTTRRHALVLEESALQPSAIVRSCLKHEPASKVSKRVCEIQWTESFSISNLCCFGKT